MYHQINDFTWHREERTPQVWLLCSQPDSIPVTCKSGKKIAFTDPDPYPYTWDPAQWLPSSGIGFCSSFFDAKNPVVNHYLFSKTGKAWCQGKTWDDYYNVGFFALDLFVGMDAYGGLFPSIFVSGVIADIAISISEYILASDRSRIWTASLPFHKLKQPDANRVKVPSSYHPRSSNAG